jgi:general stress protein YciG
MEMEETGPAKREPASADEETRARVAREGGVAPHNIRGLVEYGIEFYHTMGEKGGDSVKQKYSVDFHR